MFLSRISCLMFRTQYTDAMTPVHGAGVSLLCIVSKLPLRDQCFTNDICADVYAQCIQGVCACVAGSQVENNTCCKRRRIIF